MLAQLPAGRCPTGGTRTRFQPACTVYRLCDQNQGEREGAGLNLLIRKMGVNHICGVGCETRGRLHEVRGVHPTPPKWKNQRCARRPETTGKVYTSSRNEGEGPELETSKVCTPSETHSSPCLLRTLIFPKRPQLWASWLAHLPLCVGGVGGLKLILYFRDEGTETDRGEGDLVKAKPERGCPGRRRLEPCL